MDEKLTNYTWREVFCGRSGRGNGASAVKPISIESGSATKDRNVKRNIGEEIQLHSLEQLTIKVQETSRRGRDHS